MKHTEMIMVIEAHSEGKLIQVTSIYNQPKWVGKAKGVFNFVHYIYRVKPEPKYKTITPASYLQGSEYIDFSAEYVEIKALEDALELSSGMTMNADHIAIYKELYSLLN